VVPDYEGYCFANVPGTVGDVFAGVETDVSHVVVVLLDGLGWYRFHRTLGTAYADATFRGATQVPYESAADGERARAR